jgi:hypothetical protein
MRNQVEKQRNRLSGAWWGHDRVRSGDRSAGSGIGDVERDELTGLEPDLRRLDQPQVDLPDIVRELAHSNDFRRKAMNGRHSRAILLAKRLFYQE